MVFSQWIIKNKSPLTLSVIIKTNKLLKNFIDIKSISNLGILMIELIFIISIFLLYFSNIIIY